ncbi:MAG: hypothetical protein WCQ60_01800 [bacterium]
MQTKNIVDLLANKVVTKNIFLFKLLNGMNEADQIKVIEGSIHDLAQVGRQDEAMELIQLLWPAIVMSDPGAAIEEDDGSPLGHGINLKLTGLSDGEQFELDSSLEKYAVFCQELLLRLVGVTPLQVKVIRMAAYELLCAAHLMRDSEKAKGFFTCYIGYLAGYHFQTNSWPLEEQRVQVPALLRDSLKNTPLREGQERRKNLLAYLLTIKRWFEHESGRQQAEIIMQVAEVVIIAICHEDPMGSYKLFLDIAERRLGKK